MDSKRSSSDYGLRKLSGSDFEIVDGQPDIRGWDVKDDNGKTIGEVDELLFDERTRKVRYIIVDLDDNDFDLEDREVLVPIGLAQLHENDDDVILPGVTADQLRSLPEYDEDNFTDDHEDRVRNVFGEAGIVGAGAFGAQSRDDYYNHDHFDDQKLYGKRKSGESQPTIPVIREELEVGKETIEIGGIRLRSRIVENTVNEDITLKEEKVSIKRTPVDREATESDLVEDTLERTEIAEVPVVNKEARVVEEISLSKEVTERDETIRDTVRNTEVDVDRIDNNNRESKL